MAALMKMFKPKKKPQAAAVATPDDQRVLEAKKRKLQAMSTRGGRASTQLSNSLGGMDKLG